MRFEERTFHRRGGRDFDFRSQEVLRAFWRVRKVRELLSFLLVVARLVGSQLLGRVAQPGCQQPCYQHWHGEQDEDIAHLAWYASPENVENVENVIGQGGMG